MKIPVVQSNALNHAMLKNRMFWAMIDILWSELNSKEIKKPCRETRLFVGAARFELTISWSQTKRDTGLRYTPNVYRGAKIHFIYSPQVFFEI